VVQAATNYYILFVNAQREQLSDERVRQAISLGIDREQIRDVAVFGRAHVTAPIAAAYTEWARPLDQVPYYTRDVERAKQLLADAGTVMAFGWSCWSPRPGGDHPNGGTDQGPAGGDWDRGRDRPA
jgi:ABC-type transport system substrate-binding protein